MEGISCHWTCDHIFSSWFASLNVKKQLLYINSSNDVNQETKLILKVTLLPFQYFHFRSFTPSRQCPVRNFFFFKCVHLCT